jgi:hypothetical protein
MPWIPRGCDTSQTGTKPVYKGPKIAYYNYINQTTMTLNKVLTIQNIAIAAVTFTASSIFGQMILTQEAAARCYGPAMPEAPVCQLVEAPHLN